jgi:hypothetical protein
MASPSASPSLSARPPPPVRACRHWRERVAISGEDRRCGRGVGRGAPLAGAHYRRTRFGGGRSRGRLDDTVPARWSGLRPDGAEGRRVEGAGSELQRPGRRHGQQEHQRRREAEQATDRPTWPASHDLTRCQQSPGQSSPQYSRCLFHAASVAGALTGPRATATLRRARQYSDHPGAKQTGIPRAGQGRATQRSGQRKCEANTWRSGHPQWSMAPPQSGR